MRKKNSKQKDANADAESKRDKKANLQVPEGDARLQRINLLEYGLVALGTVVLGAAGLLNSAHESLSIWLFFVSACSFDGAFFLFWKRVTAARTDARAASRRKLLFWAVAAVALLLSIWWQIDVIHKRAATPGQPFDTRVVTTLFTVPGRGFGPMWFAYQSKYGNTISPIQVAAYVRIVNRQDVPSLIDQFTVEAASGTSGWTKLIRMDTRTGTVFWAYEGLDKAIEYDISENGLERVLMRPLQPHETVHGWAFFEVPPQAVAGVLRFRITLQDTAGAKWVHIDTEERQQTNPNEFIQGAQMKVIPGRRDISRSHITLYSEFHK